MSSRLDRIVHAVAERELDALVILDEVGLRYATGFTGTNGVAVIGPGVLRFATDFRYVEQAQAQVTELERSTAERDALLAVPDLVPERRPLRLGFDDERTSVRDHRRLADALGDGVDLLPAGALSELREVKDAGELDRIRATAALADDAFRAVIEPGIVGRSEREVALALETAMRARGAESVAFAPIVAAGAHGALPHAEPRDVPIPPDTLVVVDWGARLDGYCSDCTRTVATGPVDETAREVYELVRRAQATALDAVAAGRDGTEVDAIARTMIDEAGHGERFGHGLGHGVGLEVHEGPRLSRRAGGTLRAGNVVTVEPGVYLPGHLGVRIEDLVVVTDGTPEVLTGLPKELLTIDAVAA